MLSQISNCSFLKCIDAVLDFVSESVYSVILFLNAAVWYTMQLSTDSSTYDTWINIEREQQKLVSFSIVDNVKLVSSLQLSYR